MDIPFLDLHAQYLSIKHEIDNAIMSTVRSVSFIGGMAHEMFKKNLSSYIGVKNTILVGNGTDALIIALKSLKLPPNSEVIVPANSFIATSEAVTAAGCKVVFCDIKDDTFNIDPECINSLITNQTKAIIAVHLYGQPCDILALKSICKSHSLYLIEDCAQAHGASIMNQKVGTFGDVATFSFYPGKNLGAYGDGGAIVTDNDELALYCQMYANHGRTEKYNHEFEGVNSRLDTVQCAILDVKLQHLSEWNERRRTIAEQYTNALRHLPWIRPQSQLRNTMGVYHLYAVRVQDRNSLLRYLADKGIHCGIHYPIGLPFLKAYKHMQLSGKDYPITFLHQNEVMSLPIFPELTDYMVAQIVDAINDYQA